jgi:hypothetical protein
MSPVSSLTTPVTTIRDSNATSWYLPLRQGQRQGQLVSSHPKLYNPPRQGFA